MATLEHIQWQLREKQKRVKSVRQVLFAKWDNSQSWDGKNMGLNIPIPLRERILTLKERHGLSTMKEVIFKALVIGVQEMEEVD